ncbi:MAG TPA: hypothetical protein V6C58_28460 [Allocoleopsis sp.]
MKPAKKTKKSTKSAKSEIESVVEVNPVVEETPSPSVTEIESSISETPTNVEPIVESTPEVTSTESTTETPEVTAEVKKAPLEIVSVKSKSSEEKTPEVTPEIISESELAIPKQRLHPIPPPSEERQYRAIGLIRAIYLPSAEQFTRGVLLTSDQTLIDSVLLGKMMSLAKHHIPLTEAHLWVVYPRTRKEDGNLHCQVVGVWEPDQLHPDYSTAVSEVNENYFSIRGEVIYQMRDEQKIVVKIRQKPKPHEDKPKFFKINLTGVVEKKLVGHFVEFQLERQGNSLLITDSNDIGTLRSKKPMGKKPFKGKPRGKSQDQGDSKTVHKTPRPIPVREGQSPKSS